MKVKFTTGIASDMWSYAPEQEVTLGSVWSDKEIPAEMGRAWLASGIVEMVKAEKPEAPPKKGAK